MSGAGGPSRRKLGCENWSAAWWNRRRCGERQKRRRSIFLRTCRALSSCWLMRRPPPGTSSRSGADDRCRRKRSSRSCSAPLGPWRSGGLRRRLVGAARAHRAWSGLASVARSRSCARRWPRGTWSSTSCVVHYSRRGGVHQRRTPRVAHRALWETLPMMLPLQLHLPPVPREQRGVRRVFPGRLFQMRTHCHGLGKSCGRSRRWKNASASRRPVGGIAAWGAPPAWAAMRRVAGAAGARSFSPSRMTRAVIATAAALSPLPACRPWPGEDSAAET
mmetsp:Transcript_95950/g.213571  ORF Transcript_95950/g.213571 Transcript_95950/m.213571 type:complete len:276 (-) Transcript_95950:79-906(-)